MTVIQSIASLAWNSRQGFSFIIYPWLSMYGCLDEWISDKNNLLKTLCFRDLPNSWKKIVTMTYSIKIRPPSSEEPVIWGYFSLTGDPKCANKWKVSYKTSPYKTAGRNGEIWSQHKCHLLYFTIKYSVVS